MEEKEEKVEDNLHKKEMKKEKEKEVKEKEKKKVDYWKVSTIVLGLLLVISLVFPVSLTGFASKNGVSEKALDFINANLVQGGGVELNDVSESNGLYKLELNVNGQNIDSYVTKNGKLLFTSAIDLSEEVTLPSNEKVEVSADDDPFLGPEDAEIVVIEFSDFECPYCAAAFGTHDVLVDRFKSQDPTWEASVPKLKELAMEGKIKFVFRDFPLTGHAKAQKASEASECADDQGKFWEYHDLLFEKQSELDIEDLKKHASDLGLDRNEFDSCLDSGKYEDEVKKDLADGQKYGVSGTPAFFVNGQLLSGAQPFSAFEKVLGLE
ncbi:hypothetical protein CL618_01820 [archaeon]|nr:hypothetical protein [archaeon]|tara:strand:- start:568 stop:1536 length:969 start_codon:yes stop_codon:yes gene_type:complete